MTKINSKKMLTVMIALAMIFSALAVISFAAQPAYAAASGTVTYNPTTLGLAPTTPSSTSFGSPTPVAQTSSLTAPTVSYGTSESQAFYEFAYPASGAATLTLSAQIAFGADVFDFTAVTPTAVASYPTTGVLVSGNGAVTGANFIVSAITLSSVGTTSTVTFKITGSFNGQTFTSSVVTENSIGSAASTYYYGYASLSGTYSYTANTPITTSVFASGGSFSTGATVYFYLSTTDSATGLALSGDSIGSTVLTSSSPTSLNQEVTFFGSGYAGGAITPGVYYILASQVSPPATTNALTTGTGSYAFPAAATQFVVQSASFEVLNTNDEPATGSNALLVGGTGIAYGTGFDSGASIDVYLSYPGGTSLTTTTANSFGTFIATFTVPQLAGTVNSTLASSVFSPASSYTVVAQETNSYSSVSFPQGGITADSAMDIAPTLVVSPVDITGAAGSSFTLSGTGFPAGGVIAASTSSSVSSSIQIENPANSALDSYTYHSAVTVSSNGQFSVSVTTQSSLTSDLGPLAILITLTDTTPYISIINEFFSPAIYVSIPNPQSPGFYFSPVPIAGDYYPTMSPAVAAVYDFPAGVPVSVYLGTTLIGNLTTDSNGFGQLPVTAVIPAMPSGTYGATAVDESTHIVANPTSGVTSPIALTAFTMATDPVGNTLFTSGILASNEYVPQNGTVTVSSYGLSPGTPYAPSDSAIGNIIAYGTNVTVTVGSVYTSTLVLPASNGTLIFTYQPFYGYYGIITGTPETISGLATGFVSSTVGFEQIGAPSVSVLVSDPLQTTSPGDSLTVTLSNLINTPKPTSFYPGTSGYYSLYIGTTEITTSSGLKTFAGSTGSVTFLVPSLTSGLYNISITYAGQPVSMALPSETTVDAMVVVSTAGTSTSSGGLAVAAYYSGGVFSGYAIAGFGLVASTAIDLIIYNSLGPHTAAAFPTTSASDGAFFDSSDLTTAIVSTIYSSSAGGTFGIVLSVGSGLTTHEFYASYTVYTTLTFSSALSSPTSPVGYIPGLSTGTTFYDFMNDEVIMSPAGLSPGTYYNVYFGPYYVGTVQALTATSFVANYPASSPTETTFEVPVVPAGSYDVNLTNAGTSKVVASEPFYVFPSYYGTLTVSSAQGLPTQYAFPGQILSFSWTPTPTPTAPLNKPGTVVVNSPQVGSFTYGTVYVTVYLNNTAYTTVPATYSAPSGITTLSGSFLAPNAAIGSYWNVSLSWTQNVYTSSSPLTIGSPISGATTQYMYPMIPAHDSYLGLVQGNGALLTAISQTEIATIEAELTSAVKTSLQVPLSELSANITALHGDIATITTSFGTMTTTLQAINATVGSISSGVVLLQTDIGSMKTSLASLNATIVSLNGSLATLSTSLGKIQTTTSALNATVTSVNNGIATVQTSLGTLTGTVTAMNSTVAQVHTTLGTLNANVSAIKTSTSGFTTLEIFLIVAIVLILITLVIAFLAVSSSNKLARKIEEQKKQ